jgi:hypothetical protein
VSRGGSFGLANVVAEEIGIQSFKYWPKLTAECGTVLSTPHFLMLSKKAWRCDWAVFMSICEPRSTVPLPASPETVASFVDACRLDGKKPATIRLCRLKPHSQGAKLTRLVALSML